MLDCSILSSSRRQGACEVVVPRDQETSRRLKEFQQSKNTPSMTEEMARSRDKTETLLTRA